MAFEDCTAEYVDLLSYNKYATRTANASEFAALKTMFSVYINTSTCAFPSKKQTHGMALLLLHYYALDDTQQPDSGGSDINRGPITKEEVGDVKIEFGDLYSSGSLDDFKLWLGKTTWGIQFLYLMKTFKSTPIVT